MPSHEKQTILVPNAPRPIGPYSIATRVDNLIFASGQLGLDPSTGELVGGGIEAETRQALVNIQHVLEAAGSSFNQVLKTTVFLRDMADFPRMNQVYAEFFPDQPPARSTIQVAALPRDAAVEIELIAVVNP